MASHVVGHVSSGADTPGSDGDKIAAQALFEEGRRLLVAGQYAEACPKFAESQRIDPSPSTLLNLANCWEKVGRAATAWVTYREAQSAASAAGRKDYVDTAERHARALASTLAQLTVTVTQPVDGMEVRRDGVAMGAPEWGLSIPVDAGSHVVEVAAAGFKPWSQTIDVPHDGAQVTVMVPVLEALPLDSASPAPAAAGGIAATPSASRADGSCERCAPRDDAADGRARRRGGRRRRARGLGRVRAPRELQPSRTPNRSAWATMCPAAGVSKENDALSDGDASTVAFVAGAAALVAGGVLWLTAPRSKTAGVAARVSVAPAFGGAVVEGTW